MEFYHMCKLIKSYLHRRKFEAHIEKEILTRWQVKAGYHNDQYSYSFNTTYQRHQTAKSHNLQMAQHYTPSRRHKVNIQKAEKRNRRTHALLCQLENKVNRRVVTIKQVMQTVNKPDSENILLELKLPQK